MDLARANPCSQTPSVRSSDFSPERLSLPLGGDKSHHSDRFLFFSFFTDFFGSLLESFMESFFDSFFLSLSLCFRSSTLLSSPSGASIFLARFSRRLSSRSIRIRSRSRLRRSFSCRFSSFSCFLFLRFSDSLSSSSFFRPSFLVDVGGGLANKSCPCCKL